MSDFYQNIAAETATPGMSKFLWAPLDTIVGFPSLPATGTTAGETAIAMGDFTFAAGKGWIDVFADQSKGTELNAKTQGDIASQSIEASGKGKVIGLTAALVEQFKNMSRTPGIAIIKTADCAADEWWVIGCDCDPALMSFDFKSGTKGGNDAKATNFELKSLCPPYKYVGAITMQSAIYITISIV